jgi:hypothetical protein
MPSPPGQEVLPDSPLEMGVGAFCLACGYPLRALTRPRCPECGHGFNPQDPATFASGRPLGPPRRLMLRPIGWPLLLLACAAALVTLRSGMTPQVDSDILAYGVLAWLGVGLLYLIRLVCRGLALNGQPSPFGRHTVRWLVPPAILVGTMVAFEARLPLRVGFELSRGAMDRFAQAALSRPAKQWPVPPQRVGIYRAKDIEAWAGQVIFTVEGSDWHGNGGFAYSPNGPPRSSNAARVFQHLSGSWYEWKTRRSGRWLAK